MDYGQIFARHVRRLRHEQDLSQEEFAERCGLTRNHVGTIERCEHSPRLKTMTAIADAFGVSLLDLLVQ